MKGNISGYGGFPGGSVVKNPLANAGRLGLSPGSERYPGGEKETTPVFLPGGWREEPGGQQSKGLQRVGHD